MNISTIQKKRFLNNIYKILYSSGSKVDESLVKSVFNEYFSINKPGFPIDVNYNILRSTSKTDVDLLNQIMVNTVFNVDVLYEAILENNEKLFSIITALNKKLESLRNKRLQLETQIDDMLFVNSNTDGYFYSYTENFSTADKLDLNLTDSVFFDPTLKNATLSTLTSEQFNVLTLENLTTVNPEFSLYINGQKSNTTIDPINFSNIFDGLTDTYWSYSVSLPQPQSVSLSITMPVTALSIISKVDGIVYTSSPTNIILRATHQDASKTKQVKSKNSRGDYDSFSFSIPADRYSLIEIVLQKNEPDYIQSDTDSPYVYNFGLRELIIGSRYHVKSGFLISAPISIPVKQNEKLVIDAISMDVIEQVNSGTSLNYYVAPDNPLAESIFDFGWKQISPAGSEKEGYSSIVYLDGSSRSNIYIKNSPESNDLPYIPVSIDSKNANEINPTTQVYPGKSVYRIATLNSDISYYNPVLLGNINSFSNSYFISADSEDVRSVYKDMNFWSEILSEKPNTLFNSTLKEQLGSLIPGINTYVNGYIETIILRENETSIVHTALKSSADFNLAIYLNGILIADMPKGTISKAIQWNFIPGINKLTVTYDKDYVGQISFSLMENLNISRYGTVFTDTFTYLDPVEYQNKATIDDYYFTIDTVFGRKEILSSKSISGDSNFIFTTKNPFNVEAIRYRVDFNRYDNPFSSPILDSIRVKFKHRDVQ
jgi:hypothetical protein